MPSEKLENLLNAALEATAEERARSGQLNVGYDAEEKSWEVIVKYHGDLLFLTRLDILVEPLIAGYAILTVPEGRISLLSEIREIEYVEKPKRLYFQLQAGKQASCILPVTLRPPYLSGRGVLIGIADSGIDYYHEDFRRPDGSTRILSLWDQSLAPDREAGQSPPEGFAAGTEFDREQIDRALESGSRSQARQLVPVRDVSGHGTAVAGIAAGIAAESDLLIVKLGTPGEDGFPRTTELMRAVTYLVKKAAELDRPIAINISFGNTYGSHDGSSLLERFLDNAAEIGRNVICVGSGNEGASRGHASGLAFEGTKIDLAVGDYERTFSVQLWKNYADKYRLTLISPGGERFAFETEMRGAEAPAGQTVPGVRLQRFRLEQTEILLYVGDATPYSTQQEIYFDFLPVQNYVNRGIWEFFLQPIEAVTGSYSFYLPSQTSIGEGTVFLQASPDATLTIPSTASGVITVGAYDSRKDAYADFSGRGYLFATGAGRIGIAQSKPDLAAPGVGIMTAASGGGKISVTGTSFAAPFVTGVSALLMQWGILQGNDRYLYGQKVKACLHKGARKLPGFEQFPNELTGYGALCAKESLPG